MAVAVTLLATIAAYLAFERELERREMAALGDYVFERTLREERQFSDLANVHRAATEALERRMAALSPSEAERLFRRISPPRATGPAEPRPTCSTDAPPRRAIRFTGWAATCVMRPPWTPCSDARSRPPCR